MKYFGYKFPLLNLKLTKNHIKHIKSRKIYNSGVKGLRNMVSKHRILKRTWEGHTERPTKLEIL